MPGFSTLYSGAGLFPSVGSHSAPIIPYHPSNTERMVLSAPSALPRPTECTRPGPSPFVCTTDKLSRKAHPLTPPGSIGNAPGRLDSPLLTSSQQKYLFLQTAEEIWSIAGERIYPCLRQPPQVGLVVDGPDPQPVSICMKQLRHFGSEEIDIQIDPRALEDIDPLYQIGEGAWGMGIPDILRNQRTRFDVRRESLDLKEDFPIKRYDEHLTQQVGSAHFLHHCLGNPWIAHIGPATLARLDLDIDPHVGRTGKSQDFT